MLENTLKEIRERGYEVIWSYDEPLDEILVRVRKDQKTCMTAIQRGGNSREIEFMLDMAIRSLVEKLEKGEGNGS